MKRIVALFLTSIALASLSAQDILLNASGSLDAAAAQNGQLRWFEVEADAGSMLTVETASLDFQPILQMESPDGQTNSIEGSDQAASLSMISPLGGRWRIGVGVRRSDSSVGGSFLLKVSATASRDELEIGRTLRQSMSSNVPLDATQNRRIVWYPLELQAGQRARVLLESGDFDAHLYILHEGGDLESIDDSNGTDSEARLHAIHRQTYMIGASSHSNGGTGVYFLTTEEMEAPRQLTVDSPISAEFDDNSSGYEFIARRSGDYIISLTGLYSDPILQVRLSDGRSYTDHSGSGGNNSELFVHMDAGQAAEIQPQQYYETNGSYTLEVTTASALTIGQEESAVLQHIDFYTISGEEGDYIDIVVQSSQTSPHLEVEDSVGNRRSGREDQSAASSHESIVQYYFTRADNILVRVSNPTNVSGSYIIRSNTSEDEPPVNFIQGYELQPGEHISGVISAEDEGVHPRGASDRYVFTAEQGARIRISMTSDELDSYLILVAPDGREYTNDDGGSGVDSLIDMAAPVSGLYEIYASDLGGDYGPYELSLRSGGQISTILDTGGRISSSDPRDASGDPYDEFEVELEAGAEIGIDLTSEDFDTVLEVKSSSGERVARNDDFDGTDSRVEFTPEVSGTYSVIVTPYSSSDYGEYQLQVYAY